VASLAASKCNLPTTIGICATVNIIHPIVDGFLEGTFVGRIGVFIVGVMALTRGVIGSVRKNILFLWRVRGFGDFGDFRW